MRFNTRGKSILLVLFGILIGVSFLNSNILISATDNGISVDISGLKTSAISGKIHILNNWTDAKSAGICTGEGINSDPYLIRDLIIHGNNSGSGIWIENSTATFLITNCTVTNVGTELYDAAIRLWFVDNGQIVNNIIVNNKRGMYLNYSNNNLVVGNTFINDYGIRTIFSNNNYIYFNNLQCSNTNLFTQDSTNFYSTPHKMVYIYNNQTHTNYLGNFWSEYHGTDGNGDGVGSSPVIFTNSHVLYIDYYPLMETIENYKNLRIAKELPTLIPGYNLIIIIVVLSIALVILIKKYKRS